MDKQVTRIQQFKNVGTARELSRHMHVGQEYGIGCDYFNGHIQPVVDFATKYVPKHIRDHMGHIMQIAYLHDIVEDTDVSNDEIKEFFGYDVAIGVSLCTNNGVYNNSTPYCLNRGSEIGVILGAFVKICDRIINLRKCTISGSNYHLKKYINDHDNFVTSRVNFFSLSSLESLYMLQITRAKIKLESLSVD